MKLKKLLSESKVWERKFGEPLPTLEDTTKRFKMKQENLNDSFKPKFRDTEKLAKKIGKNVNDVVKFLKDYEVEADDLMDVIEAGGRRYHLMVVAAIGGNQKALRKLDDLLGFMG
tara:strand:+ start:328 stop:672 length:345 start_codon:yes stop_codon:yes gene_type:complete